MGARWLTDLADVCRAAGLVVYEVDGWQDRSRSSGGFDAGYPDHVMCHHTASGPSSDGWPDVNYMCYSSDIRPVANLYLSRAGEVWAMAAGATNTNGQGADPCGAVADDSMNTAAVGIEAGNDGVGEAWPPAQQDAYIVLVAALCAAYGIDAGRVHSHAEWTDRKIDPAGPSRWAPAGGTWPMDAFRLELAAPTPTPTSGGFADPMFCTDADTGKFWIVTTDWQGDWAAPLEEIPGIDWARIGPVSDAVNGPLRAVSHDVLQHIYDHRGRPATP
jgi:hypothetical protein